jgi:hypothetical protein
MSNEAISRHRYLFLTGCARSGTSAMADFLRNHPSIAMGKERFAYRYLVDRSFPPALFERERFCRQLIDGDSHHRHLDPYYEELYPRFEQCFYRGDKIPEMAQDYGPLLASFSHPKVVYMLRNCFDVADSYSKRAAASDGWPRDRGVTDALLEWNLALQNTLAAIDQLDVIFIVYETFFADRRLLQRLFSFLQLPIVASVLDAYDGFAREHQQLDQERRNALSSTEKLYIMQNADFGAYRRALQLTES